MTVKSRMHRCDHTCIMTLSVVSIRLVFILNLLLHVCLDLPTINGLLDFQNITIFLIKSISFVTSHNGITLKLQPTIRQYKQSDFNKQSDSHAGNYSGFGVYFLNRFSL